MGLRREECLHDEAGVEQGLRRGRKGRVLKGVDTSRHWSSAQGGLAPDRLHKVDLYLRACGLRGLLQNGPLGCCVLDLRRHYPLGGNRCHDVDQ
jgi:hypothetical protein